jgi:hypothetical protein
MVTDTLTRLSYVRDINVWRLKLCGDPEQDAPARERIKELRRLLIGKMLEGVCIPDTFDAELDEFLNGTLPTHKAIQLGQTSPILRMFGLPDLRIEATLGVLRACMRPEGKRHGHSITGEQLRAALKQVHAPIAVFTSRDSDNLVFLTEVSHPQGTISVAIEASITRWDGKEHYEVNDIRSVFPRRDDGVRLWLNEGRLLGYDKERGSHLVEAKGTNRPRHPLNRTSAPIIYNAMEIFKSCS